MIFGRVTPRPPLTPRQLEILTYIRGYIHANNYAPTMSEVGANFGVSEQRIWRCVQLFIAKGYLESEPKQHWRGIRLPMQDRLKTCSQCGESHPETVEYFRPDNRFNCWKSTKCRKCLNADERRRTQTNRAAWRAVWRERYYRQKAKKAAEIAARFKAR
jgi:hypothetical protein